MSSPALLLVDLQHGFLEDPRLRPPAALLVERAARLLEACRRRGLTVLHARFVTEPSGAGRLPHHAPADRWVCVRGTRSADPPPALAPRASEVVFEKHGYSAFAAPGLADHLRALSPDPLILAGLHLHACVRATALDAWELSLRVWIAGDATGSYDSLHADLTEVYLSERGIRFLDTSGLIESLDERPATPAAPAPSPSYPVASVGSWIAAGDAPTWEQRNPSEWSDVLGHVPLADREIVSRAVAGTAAAQQTWSRIGHARRLAVVTAWAEALEARADALAQVVVTEVGKPVREARLEIARGAETLRVLARRFEQAPAPAETAGGKVEARRRPCGVIAAVTPWNNPVAIPLAKIGPALLFGNGVVWKPALECPRTSLLLYEALVAVGAESAIVTIVFGGASTVRDLIAHPGVGAVSFTGSTRAGRQVVARCAHLCKPVQGELGGNNAAIVLSDCDLEAAACELCHAAFDFAGQGCTATRRLIVAAEVAEPFRAAFERAMRGLVVGLPAEASTRVGPVISRTKQRRVRGSIEECAASGIPVVSVDVEPRLLERGCWVPPTLVVAEDPGHPLVQEESFAPLAVLLTASHLDDALRLANQVPQGLVASLYSQDAQARARFLDEVEAGVLKLGQPTRGVHPDAPFSGWKESGFGPPEHGVWDVDAYTRWQAIYR